MAGESAWGNAVGKSVEDKERPSKTVDPNRQSRRLSVKPRRIRLKRRRLSIILANWTRGSNFPEGFREDTATVTSARGNWPFFGLYTTEPWGNGRTVRSGVKADADAKSGPLALKPWPLSGDHIGSRRLYRTQPKSGRRRVTYFDPGRCFPSVVAVL